MAHGFWSHQGRQKVNLRRNFFAKPLYERLGRKKGMKRTKGIADYYRLCSSQLMGRRCLVNMKQPTDLYDLHELLLHGTHCCHQTHYPRILYVLPGRGQTEWGGKGGERISKYPSHYLVMLASWGSHPGFCCDGAQSCIRRRRNLENRKNRRRLFLSFLSFPFYDVSYSVFRIWGQTNLPFYPLSGRPMTTPVVYDVCCTSYIVENSLTPNEMRRVPL